MLYNEALDRLHQIVRRFPAIHSNEDAHVTIQMPVGERGLVVQLIAYKNEGLPQPVQLRSNLSAIEYQVNLHGYRDEVDKFVDETFPEPRPDTPQSLNERWINPASAILRMPGTGPRGGLILSIKPFTQEEAEAVLGSPKAQNREN